MMRIQILLVAVVTLHGPVLQATSRADTCASAASVAGAPELVDEINHQLLVVGIERKAESGCPVVRVRVRARANHLLLTLSDGDGRRSVRSVGNAVTAAAVIASWSKRAPANEFPVAAPGSHGRSAPVTLVQRASPAQTDGGGISVMLEAGLDSHDQRWTGGAVAGCIQISSLCLGALARLGSAEARHLPVSRSPILVGGSGYDVLATAALPRVVAGVVLSPQLSVGFGRLHFDWDYGPSNQYRTSAHGLRLGARVSTSYVLGRGYSIELATSLDTLPADYERYDVPGVPERRFSYHTTFRASLGLRHTSE